MQQIPFDVLLLDILLPEQNGIALASRMIAAHPHAAVIYFTGYPLEYCEAIFEGVKPFGYLKKPVDYEKLEKLLREAEIAEKPAVNELYIKYHGSQIVVPQAEILCLESHGRTVTIHCTEKQFVVYARLSDLEQQLPVFIRCHTSYLVNPAFICSLEKNKFTLKDDETEVPISRKYQKSARVKFFEYKGDLNV